MALVTRARTRWLSRGALVLAVVLAIAAPLVRPARANIQEQRARLPPPATCTDPVEGVWMAHKYNPAYTDWSIFTLEIRHAPGNPAGLVGVIKNHGWSGGPQQSEPPGPPCRPGQKHWVVSMPAQGRYANGRIEFWATSWTLENRICELFAGYNLDRFSGTIDPAIQEFQSVNNDGGRAVNDPAVFRRVRCLDSSTSVPHTKVAPPPFYPHITTGGCGREP